MLKVALGTSAGLVLPEITTAAKPPEKMRPQAEDIVVHRFGDRKGEPIRPQDVPLGTDLVQATVMDPQSRIVRDGSRFNGLNLVRLEPDQLNDKTRRYSADGIMAYSTVCTHQGCDLNAMAGRRKDVQVLLPLFAIQSYGSWPTGTRPSKTQIGHAATQNRRQYFESSGAVCRQSRL